MRRRTDEDQDGRGSRWVRIGRNQVSSPSSALLAVGITGERRKSDRTGGLSVARWAWGQRGVVMATRGDITEALGARIFQKVFHSCFDVT